jgi:hypothetical protein
MKYPPLHMPITANADASFGAGCLMSARLREIALLGDLKIRDALTGKRAGTFWGAGFAVLAHVGIDRLPIFLSGRPFPCNEGQGLQ